MTYTEADIACLNETIACDIAEEVTADNRFRGWLREQWRAGNIAHDAYLCILDAHAKAEWS